MPKGNILYHELDPSDFNSFDFQLFLGALLTDLQTFIVKTPPNPDGSPSMSKNEIIFAFSILGNEILPHDIIIPPSSIKAVRPGFKTLFTRNLEYNYWMTYWNSVINSFKNSGTFVGLHRFENLNDWLECCRRAGVPSQL